MLKVGDQAPGFNLLSDKQTPVQLKDFLGKKVLLYFYPKDNTPGCTRQACDLRDSIQSFDHHQVEVLGISKDSSVRHQKFKTKYELPYTLLADESGDVCEAYGVLDKKSLFGRTFLGITRSTFLIDEKGAILAIWRKVKVNEHVKQVLDELK